MVQNGGGVGGMYWAGEEDRLCRMCGGGGNMEVWKECGR